MTQAVPPEGPPERRWREGPHPGEMTGGLGVGHRRGPFFPFPRRQPWALGVAGGERGKEEVWLRLRNL